MYFQRCTWLEGQREIGRNGIALVDDIVFASHKGSVLLHDTIQLLTVLGGNHEVCSDGLTCTILAGGVHGQTDVTTVHAIVINLETDGIYADFLAIAVKGATEVNVVF